MTQKADNIIGISVSLVALLVLIWGVLYDHKVKHDTVMKAWETGYHMGRMASPDSWLHDSLYIESLLKNEGL